jgi:tetratricopeptide (TPR) repeat protein
MSFATTYSRSFERLSRTLLSQQLGLPEESIVLTQAVRDGGQDGVAELRLGRIFDDDLTYRFAFEAKLRSRTNPGFDTFAKAMMIAFNGRRHGLAVTTNRLFTPQCLSEAAQFHFRTGLQFIFVDGPRISLWVRPRLERLAGEGYAADFLDQLLWPGDEGPDMATAVAPLEISCATGLVPTVSVSVSEAGSAPGERLLASVETRSLKGDGVDWPSLFGAGRIRTLERLRDAVAGQAGLHLLWGEGGVGKSVLVGNLIQDFALRGWSVACVNLRTCFTARDLFLKLLSALLGVDLSAALAEAGSEGAVELISQMLGPDGEGGAGASRMAAAALSARPETAALAPGLDHAVLITLLEQAAEKRRQLPGRPIALIVIQEATYATPEMFDFLSRALAVLSARDVRLILESRFHDYERESSRDWEAFRLAARSSAMSEVTLAPFSRGDARSYLETLLPGLGQERADVITGRVGTIPLFLDTARDFLRQRGAVTVHQGAWTIVEDLEAFFEGINPETPAAMIRHQIEHWGRHYPALLHAAALLGGHLPAATVPALADGDAVELLDGLVATGLFEPAAALDGVQARHGLIIDALEEFTAKAPFRARSVAEALLPCVDALTQDPLTRRAREADLKAVAGLKAEAIGISHEVGRGFGNQQQLELGARYLRQAYKLSREVAEHPGAFGARPADELWTVLFDLLELDDKRHRLGTREAAPRLADARQAWEEPAIMEGIAAAERLDLRLRAGYVVWRAEFLRELFDRAHPLAERLFSVAEDARSQPGVSTDLVGRGLAALGTTLKAVGRADASRAAFARARSLCPESFNLELQEHSNQAALALVDEPAIALLHYEEIIALSVARGSQPLDMLHVLVDRSMALFLLRRYDEAAVEAVRAERLSSANGIAAQTARARNVLGCCRWALGDPQEAYRCFEKATLDAERSFSERFLWRMRANFAGAALATGRTAQAAAQARSAAERILAPRRGSWPEGEARGRRWYHALLQCAAVLACANDRDGFDRLCAEIPEPSFRSDASAIAAGHIPHWLEHGSTSVHGDRVMITG